MIGAAALPAIKVALPYVLAGTALTGVGEYQRERARSRAMKGYNEEVDRIGNESMQNAAVARNKFRTDEMDKARGEDVAQQLEQFEESRLPDVSAPAITGVGAPKSIGNFVAGQVGREKEQADRQFRAQLELGTLSNALFGGDLAAANAAARNRNNASLIDMRRQKLETMDLPQADARGGLWRGAGQLVGEVGNLKTALSLYGKPLAQSAKTVATGGMGGIGTNAPRTVSDILRGGTNQAQFRGLGGIPIR